MRPSFNTAGPCLPGEHFTPSPMPRLGYVMRLIDEHKIFAMTAGLHSGKTTSALWIARHLNTTEDFRALRVDLKVAGGEPNREKAFLTILDSFEQALHSTLPDLAGPTLDERNTWLSDPSTCILKALSWLVRQEARRWVVLFDDADGLVGKTMVSFLSQLRAGYIQRDKIPFPASVVLVGQRQICDYLFHEESRAFSWPSTTSPFDMPAEAVAIGIFSESDTTELLHQHAEATGQPFLPEAINEIFRLTQGHPWLTNAMADQIVNRDVTDRSIPITAAHVKAAKEAILLQPGMHLDALIAQLSEDRVRRILDPMLVGNRTAADAFDDFSYVIGLGLVRIHEGVFEIANPIYREVIPRALTFGQQVTIPNQQTIRVVGC